MDSLYIAGYVARQRAASTLGRSADSSYAQYGRSGGMLGPLASVLVIVAGWIGLISLIPSA